MGDFRATTLVVTNEPVIAAAQHLADAVERAIAATGRARLAVPGGSAAAALGVARRSLKPSGAWVKISLTWVDERCVPFADSDSNRGGAYRAGLLDAREPPRDELALYQDGEAPETACARVEAALATRFDRAIDVALLGMGEDGHVASLFPGRSSVAARPVEHVADSPKPPSDRITLTRGMLATAARSVLLATGESKRDALARVLSGDVSFPAVGLANLVVVTDLVGLEGGGA